MARMSSYARALIERSERERQTCDDRLYRCCDEFDDAAHLALYGVPRVGGENCPSCGQRIPAGVLHG